MLDPLSLPPEMVPSTVADTLGREYGRPHDGRYLQNWNPLMLASELEPGKIYGRNFLGTRVILYRDADGAPVVQSAYCPHVGADLSGGELIDGQVRCPYHHWQFAADGRCSRIPSIDTKPPRVARLYNYPAGERWGIIWAFNGAEALYGLPEMPNLAEDELVYEPFHHGLRRVEGWISASNLVDFQHLGTVHGIPDANPVRADFEPYRITVRQESAERIFDSQLDGGTWLGAHGQYADGTERFFMAGSSQVAPGISDAFFVVAMRKSLAEQIGMEAARERFRKQIDYMYKLYGEDEPILFNLRFRGRRKSALIAPDLYFSRYLDYIEDYPRAAPFDV